MSGTDAPQQLLEATPAPVAAAEAWFDRTYAAETISAVCRVRDGQASALVRIPPTSPAVLQLILKLADGMFREGKGGTA